MLAYCRLAEGEKTNGRWAMMAVVGILGQEILGVHPAWYMHGEKVYICPTLNGLPFSQLLAALLHLTHRHTLSQGCYLMADVMP